MVIKMIVSTKGRYALRVIIDLAEHQSESYIPMKDVANRQHVSLKYMEKIMPVLSKNNLVEGVHGKGGGYRLTRTPDAYTVGEILRLTEGDMAPVACLECHAIPCDKTADCRTLPMWTDFYKLINEYFDGITIAHLMKK